jgi:hypothetical protein
MVESFATTKSLVVWDVIISGVGFAAFVLVSCVLYRSTPHEDTDIIHHDAVDITLDSSNLQAVIGRQQAVIDRQQAVIEAANSRHREDPWLKRWGNAWLALMSLADAGITLRIMLYLQGMNTVQSLALLFDSSCFSRLNDRIVIDASDALESYVEETVVAQVSIALAAMMWHLIKAFYRKDAHVVELRNITDGLSGVLFSFVFESAELIASMVAFTKFVAVHNNFLEMYAKSNTDIGTVLPGQAESCVYSCCQ